MEYRMNYCAGKCTESSFVRDGLVFPTWKRGGKYKNKTWDKGFLHSRWFVKNRVDNRDATFWECLL